MPEITSLPDSFMSLPSSFATPFSLAYSTSFDRVSRCIDSDPMCSKQISISLSADTSYEFSEITLSNNCWDPGVVRFPSSSDAKFILSIKAPVSIQAVAPSHPSTDGGLLKV